MNLKIIQIFKKLKTCGCSREKCDALQAFFNWMIKVNHLNLSCSKHAA